MLHRNTSFDPGAQIYHQSRILPETAERALIAPLLDAFAGAAPMVLDIGAGTGRFAGPLAQQTGWPIYALDLAPKMLVKAGREYQGSPLQCICADAMYLPIGRACFSGIIISSMLHFVADWRVVLAEAIRVLAGSGSIMLLLGRIYETDPPVRRILHYLREKLAQPPTNMPQIEEIRQFLTARGYRYHEVAPVRAEQRSTPRAALELIAYDAFPTTWELELDRKRELLLQAATWAKHQWPDLDREVTATMSWRWHRFIAPADPEG